MSCGSSVLPLIIPAVPGDEIVQGTPKLREDLLLHLEAPIEVVEMFAQQEGLGCRVFSSYLPWVLHSFRGRVHTALWRLVRWRFVGDEGSESLEI
ncbi:hypothetical protein E4U52_000493 [Claviceps spartinae]|nr:hypothetical protein E4U52_000493 [Claviceps spartinae]